MVCQTLLEVPGRMSQEPETTEGVGLPVCAQDTRPVEQTQLELAGGAHTPITVGGEGPTSSSQNQGSSPI